MELTDKDYNEALIRYLEKHDSEVWHQVAMSWNWDGDNEPLTWIIRQPECDAATASLIYWKSGAGYYCQYSSRDEVKKFELDLYDLVTEIETNFRKGFYKNSNFYFDPADDEGSNWTTEYQEFKTKKTIPEILLNPIKGRKVERANFVEGYPQEVIDEVEEKSLK